MVASVDLGRAFRASSDAAYWQRLEAHYKKEREARERREDINSDAAEFLDMALALVTAEEVAAFKIELDSYDAATVAALQENERELARVQELLEPHLMQAHVLPDGTRVFKTLDGTRVFDEHGQEVAAEALDPEAIANDRPRWETVQPLIEQRNGLLRARSELLNYQAKLDDARDRVDRGDLSREGFETMREDLKASMPDAVRSHVAGMEKSAPADVTGSGPTAEEDLDISPSAVPKILAPGM